MLTQEILLMNEKNHEIDALSHIKNLCDLEWNGSITILEFRKQVNKVIDKFYTLKRWNTKK